MDQVTVQPSPTKAPLPRRWRPSTFARSLATDGFSATTSLMPRVYGTEPGSQPRSLWPGTLPSSHGQRMIRTAKRYAFATSARNKAHLVLRIHVIISVDCFVTDPEDTGGQLNLDRAELRGVARRPARGSPKNFLLDMKSLLSFRALRAAVAEFQRDDALGLAAQLAFYLIFALFPFLLVLVSLMGTFSSPELAEQVLGYFREVTPEQVYGIIESYLSDIIAGNRPAPGLFSVGLVIALWSASGAFAALIDALNKAYDVEETRPFWKVRGIALLMTLGLSVMIIVGVLLLVAGPPIGRGIADLLGLGEVFTLVWNVVQWPVALSLMVFAVALLYYFAPDAGQPFRWITPGGLIGVLLWVLASVIFRFYVSNFGSYDATYGSIGAVIVLLLYLYISSLTILLGAELNATLVRLKEEISGEQVLDAEPAGEKPDILEENQQGARD